MNYIVANNVAPDQYTWHLLDSTTNPSNDMKFSVATMEGFYSSARAPRKGYSVNEYISGFDVYILTGCS